MVPGLFSTARAARAVSEVVDVPVITTPDSAVRDLHERLAAVRAAPA